VTKDELRSILVYGGFPLSAKHVVDEVVRQIKLRAAEAHREVVVESGSWEE